MKKIMMGVSLGLAGMSQAHAWNGGIEDMRTLQDNTSGQVVRVKSSTTDCCTLRPMHSHGHAHQRKIIHHGQTYYCTRVAGHGQQVTHHKGGVKKHYQRQAQQSVHAQNAQRAKRQAMYAAQAKRKALLLAQQRQRAAALAAQKRKNVLIAQQKQRAAHQALMQAQQRKRAALQLQQQRKLQLLAQQRRKAAQQRLAQQRIAQQRAAQHKAKQHHVVSVKPQPRYHAPPPPQRIVTVQPRYESSYQRYHYQQVAPQVRSQQSVQRHDQWQRSKTIRMQPIQRVVKPQYHSRAKQPVRYSGQQSVARHDAAQGWQRAATVQSHRMRTQPPPKRQVVAMAHTGHEADCGC